MAMADDGAADVGVTPAQRRALRRLHDSMEAFEAQLQCPICLCAYSTPASLPCNHCFCEECIHRALELKQVCPICKAPAKKRSLRHDTMIQQLQQAVELWQSVPYAVDLSDVQPFKPTRPEASPTTTTSSEATNDQTTPVRINPLIAVQSAESVSRRRKRDQEEEHSDIDTNGNSIPTATLDKVVNGNNGSASRIPHPSMDNGAEHKATVVEPPAQKKRAINGTHSANGFTSHKTAVAEQPASDVAVISQQNPFISGQLVEVIDRTWRGINKPGGAAWITSVNGDGTYDVKYVLDARREARVLDQYVLTASEDIASQTTPSKSVKRNRRKIASKLATPPSVDLLGGNGYIGPTGLLKSVTSRTDMVFLCSGFSDDETDKIQQWAIALGAQVVDQWSQFVTHLIAKCATPQEVAASAVEEDGEGSTSQYVAQSRKRSLFKDDLAKRWVKIRSMKYLKALLAGRWIVSERWLKDSVKQGKRLAEAAFEADGHLKAQNIVAACQRARTMREELLRITSPEANAAGVGTRLFSGFCFYVFGEFLPPMPPPSELDMLIRIGDGKVLRFLDEIEQEMARPEHRGRPLVIVSDKLHPQMLRRVTKELTALPQLQHVQPKHVVSYQWLLNSISDVKVRPFA